MKVPEYNDTFPSEDRMNSEQERFYHFWMSSWHSGNPIPLDGQESYAFCYLYSILSFPVQKVTGVLEHMYSAYPEEGVLTSCVRRWLSDCYVVERRYANALEVFPIPPLGSPKSYMTDKRLNLKLLTGNRISGREGLATLGPRISMFDQTILPQIADYVDIQLRAREADKNVNVLKTWAPSAPQTRYEIFTGYLGATEINLPFYHFSMCEVAVEELLNLAREAETTAKEEQGVPKATEAWADETQLCIRLKKFFSDEPVIHHHRPDWLGRKHLDILLPKRGIAVEYRVPKEVPTGVRRASTTCPEESHNGDTEKRNLCEAHGIQVVEVGPGYNFDSLIGKIIKRHRRARQ